MTSVTSRLRAFQRLGLRILLLSTLSWFLMLELIEGSEGMTSWHRLVFAFLASVATYLLLRWFGYFHLLRWQLRKSDFLPILLAIPASALIADTGFRVVHGRAICGVESLIYASVALSCWMFLFDIALRRLDRRLGYTGVIALLISGPERRRLRNQFRMRGYLDRVTFISREQLEAQIAAGRARNIDFIVISRDDKGSFEQDSVVVSSHLLGIPVIDKRALWVELSQRVALDEVELWSYIFEATPQTPMVRFFAQVKRVMEPALATVLLLVFSPLFLIVSLLIRLSDGGPILFRQDRVGFGGRIFTLVKFRSMCIDAERDGPQFACHSDKRITRLGKFLRASRIDELPQLLNVIRGEMSFVGPRPERPEIYKKLSDDIPLFWIRTLVRPGISGWAQIHSGYAATVEESREKLEYDLYYIQHMSPRLDFIVTLLTVKSALFGVAREKRVAKREKRQVKRMYQKAA